MLKNIKKIIFKRGRIMNKLATIEIVYISTKSTKLDVHLIKKLVLEKLFRYLLFHSQ